MRVSDDGRSARDLADDRMPLVNVTMTSRDVTSVPTNDDVPSALVRFSVWYSGVHGYLCIAVCVFGVRAKPRDRWLRILCRVEIVTR